MSNNNCFVEFDIINNSFSIFKKHFEPHTPLLIADKNTWNAAGRAVEKVFKQADNEVHSFIFPDIDQVYADDTHVAIIRTLLEKNNHIAVAIGSGTINDLVKRASYEVNKSYMVIATAPSVDGYTASDSAITVNGFKTTLLGAPPTVVIGDLDVLRNAPLKMIAAGYGDLSAKISAGAEWIITDILGIEPIDKFVWEMVQGPLRKRLSKPNALKKRDASEIKGLFLGLAEVGYAMAIYKDSRPASGAEHMMSHVWEMEHLTVNGFAPSHGFKVAIGTLSITAFITELLKMDTSEIRVAVDSAANITWEERETDIFKFFTEPRSRQGAQAASKAKFIDGASLKARQTKFVENWEEIRIQVRQQIIPFEELSNMYLEIGCPTEPADIGLTNIGLEQGFKKAQQIRSRYTVLDLAYECGVLQKIIDKIVYGKHYFKNFVTAQGIQHAN